MAIQDPDKRGYYIVGWKKFYNKTQALTYATKYNFIVRWIFNDTVYSDIDWTIPIETSLPELYRQRAQQLRDSYDYIVLHYSGGQDSNNVLHSFIDNNIKLDKIVIQVPEPERKSNLPSSTGFENYWAEIDYQAIPYLKKLGDKLRGIEISIQDLSKSPIELLSSQYWTEKLMPNASFNLGVIARAMTQYTSVDILKLVDTGKTSCQLLGIDKPLITIHNDEYYCYFADQSAYHAHPIDNTMSDIFTNTVTEYFYWTPNMPEIVVKQAQEIKKVCESNVLAKQLFTNGMKQYADVFRNVMQSIIYNVEHAPKFQTDKPKMDQGTEIHKWFFEGDDKNLIQNYQNALTELSNHIENVHYLKGNPNLGYASITSKFYKL